MQPLLCISLHRTRDRWGELASGWCALIRTTKPYHPLVFRSFSKQLAELCDQRVEEDVLVQIFVVASHRLSRDRAPQNIRPQIAS